MADTSQDLEAARAFYTRISSVYDALADRDEHRARELGLSLLDAQGGERILEIGFGTGSSIVPLAASVGASGRVCGIDIAPGMKVVAEQRMRSANMTATVDLRVHAVPPSLSMTRYSMRRSWPSRSSCFRTTPFLAC